jgi:ABC-2 type transport system ATP-binding protein
MLDEPTVGLDPVLRRDLWALFRTEAHEHGSTLVVSSHVLDEAAHCDRLLLLRDGRLIADDTPAGLLSATDAADLDDAFLNLVLR